MRKFKNIELRAGWYAWSDVFFIPTLYAGDHYTLIALGFRFLKFDAWISFWFIVDEDNY